MNILPHKSWHVRTKKNIARVRKDEAQAAEEEKERQRKIALAGQEARTAALRQRASVRLAGAAREAQIDTSSIDVSIPLAPVTDIVQQDGHVNFFQDVEEGKRQGGVNVAAEEEKRKEQDDYEKKIGYLVYLGQDSEELTKNKPWYAKVKRPGQEETRTEELQKIKAFESSGYLEGLSKDCKLSTEELKLEKFKNFDDPLRDIRKYLKTPSIAKVLESQSPPKKKRTIGDRKDSLSSSAANEPPPKKPKKAKKSKKKSKKHKHSRHEDRKERKSSKKKRRQEEEEESSSEEDSEDELKRKRLEKLRAERLEREREEKRKTEQLFAKLRGDEPPKRDEAATSSSARRNRDDYEEEESAGEPQRRQVKQKYNSQFNPQLARQNFDFDEQPTFRK